MKYLNVVNTFLALLLFFSAVAQATPVINIKGKDKDIINDYLKLHKNFFKAYCSPGTEPKFWELFKNFRGDGHYIPVLSNEKLDTVTINKFIPEIQRKRIWIEQELEQLKKIKTFTPTLKKIKLLENQIEKLLEYKKGFFEATDELEKSKMRNNSKYLFLNFKEEFRSFLKEVSFLLSYRFPVDHFELRKSYDNFKHREDDKGKSKANEIYFYRKIVQDGAQDEDHSRSDRFLRSGLDTIFLSFAEEENFISEEARYDISFSLSAIERQLKRGKNKLISRLEEWRERVKRNEEFYQSLKENKVQVGDHVESGDKIISERHKARYILKDYTLKKQAEVYHFWRKQDELMRILYVIETILYNEVGGLDGRDALERRDVTQVVINRASLDQYSLLDDQDSILPYLVSDELTKEKLNKYRWLNVLFKEGEFSFTYFFIHGSLRVYCPEMTRRGKFLRRENVSIALELLRNPNSELQAVRYYSRGAMLGRIKMDLLWKDFVAIKESPGRKARKNSTLKRLYKAGRYRYHYHFEDKDGKQYKVVEIKDNTYVIPLSNLVFYRHRSPHLFKYFRSNTP